MMETKNTEAEKKYARAKKRVERIKGFYRHLVIFLSVNTVITGIHVVNAIGAGASFTTAFWDMQTFFIWIPWGVGLVIHGICVLDLVSIFMGKGWEVRRIQEILEDDHKKSTVYWE